MSASVALPLLLLVVPSAAIECYSGLKLISGQAVGEATIQCPNSGSMCYNMSASAAVVLDVVKAGCSLWRCMLARDRCISTTFQNVPISLCCCSTDRCNVGENIGMKKVISQAHSIIDFRQVGGWNAMPEHKEKLTKEEVAQRFASMEVDDDLPATSSRGNRHQTGGSTGAHSTNPTEHTSHGSTGKTGTQATRTNPTQQTTHDSTDEVEIP